MTQPSREVWLLTSELENERASSFRQERWCHIFLEAGAALRLFNLRGAFGYSDIACNDTATLAAFRRKGLARYRGPKTSVRQGWVSWGLRHIKHLLMADLYLPNVIKLYRHLEALLRERNEPVVLMASSPPFSLALIGALLKRRYPEKIMLAVDMRDAWALHDSLGGIKPLKRAIERRVLHRADRVTTVSLGLADEFQTCYGVVASVMYNVATHYLESPLPSRIDLREVHPDIDPTRLTIVYTGSTPAHFYDIATLIGAVKRIRQRRPELARRLQLIFVGACEEVQREARLQNVDSPDIVFVTHLSHALARSVQASAAALLFLAYHGSNNRGVVSTKLFEYLCLGQPILPVDLCEGSDVDLLLRRYCGASVNAHGEPAITALLERVAEDGTFWLPRLGNAQDVRELVDAYRHHANDLLTAA